MPVPPGPLRRLLVANRGEVAIRVARSAAELGIATVGVYAEDDAASLHVARVDEARPLAGRGPRAYLDAEQLVRVAADAGCDAVHPGYGFLSERADFARLVAAAGMVLVGPSAETLELFGDKAAARRFARQCGVPVLEGTDGPASLEEAQALLARLGEGGEVMVKAVAGGGGRGMRPARTAEELAAVFDRCAAEAAIAFGDSRLYVEAYLPRARHVEVQLVGDGEQVAHVWDRECSLQHGRQKLVEVAPAVVVDEPVRAGLLEAATRLGTAVGLRSLCTVELLVADVVPATTDAAVAADPSAPYVFLEANPRLQVEHTVTEEVTGLDLVGVQLLLASGRSLAEVGLGDGAPVPRGVAVEARVELETVAPDGSRHPSTGTVTGYEPPTGPGVRVDGAAYVGWPAAPSYDSLVAKVVVHANGGLPEAVAKADRALAELRLEGPPSNVALLRSILRHPDVSRGAAHTRFVEEHLSELLADAARHPTAALPVGTGPAGRSRPAGVTRIDPTDPLAVLEYGQRASPESVDLPADHPLEEAEGWLAVRAPVAGTVVELSIAVGDAVAAGAVVAIVEAMKMEHPVTVEAAGAVRALLVGPGETLAEGQVLAHVEADAAGAGSGGAAAEPVDPARVRPDLAEVLERHRHVLDDERPEAVARRRRLGKRTARENVAALCDPGSFTEYGPLVVAGRSGRNTTQELIDQTPADGLVMGLGRVEGERVAVLAYDYTVLAGTQGARNHLKLDRIAELALRWRLPTVVFAEGGGGRPGDTDRGGFIRGFELWAKLSGAVPLVGVASGRCYAGNAALLGCCDVIVATADTALGMGGPAMVEGGGLGVYRPEEIGPLPVMQANGVVDVVVDDEPAAAAAARRYLGYFRGRLPDWSCADQRRLRHLVPENRMRAYDVRKVIEVLADDGSVMELRPWFGRAMVTALARIEGRPVGMIANDPMHLGGAIDSDASDKAARFLQVCEAFDLPVVSLSDTPGNMVGPEAETTGLVRHCSRMFVIGANLTVPILAVVLRKSYGLGAIAMTGGSYQAALFAVSWPTGEFGGMGLEGAVKLGYRKELAVIDDPEERRTAFDRMVARAYAAGRALATALHPALDDVIDPADTRRWIGAALESVPPAPARSAKKVPWIDAW